MPQRSTWFVYLFAAFLFIFPAGQPRIAHATSTTLVIQEFRTRGPNGGNDEFIQIRNISGAPLNLQNWRVMGSNANGAIFTRADLPTIILNPGCSWLLANSNTNGYGGAANQTYAIGITDDGGIALMRPDGGLADQVGLSAGSAYGEGSRLPNFGTSNGNRSYERHADTDNNAADFSMVSPSTPELAGGSCLGTQPQPPPPDPTPSPTTPPAPTSPTATGTLLPNPAAPGVPVRIQVTVTAGANPTSTGLQVHLDLQSLGGDAATVLSDSGGGSCDAIANDGVFSACLLLPRTQTPGSVNLAGTVSDAQARSSPFSVAATVAAPADSDGDGLSNACETAFGLDPNSAAGADGATGDPDHDGRSNSEECASGTHPRGLFQRYLAEGVTNSFFRTRIALFNPSDTAAIALVRLQPELGSERAFTVNVPARTRRTITPDDIATLTGAPFATVVESDVELVVDRLMVWGDGDYGSHAETAVHAPSTTWYLAEGATGWRFSLFYLLQNPSDQSADVEVSYLRGATDPVLTRTYTVGPRARRTIWVDEEEFPAGSGIKPLGATDVSARIQVTNAVPIIVERAMYMSPDGQDFGAGHAGAGVTQASTHWFFAEGATGAFFDEFLLLANPGTAPADVAITYSPEGGSPIVKTYTVPGNSRSTIWVDQIPGLEATSLSAAVNASVPIVAERAMWWPGTGDAWREAHVSVGATTSGPRWGIADLEIGGPDNADSYVLIYNGGSLTLYFDDGTAPIVCGAGSAGRTTIHVNDCPGVQGKRYVAAVVNGGADTVVERAIYYSTPAQLFNAGAASLGVPLP